MTGRAPGQLPLIVIVGPTASGKTALGIMLAKEFDGEIICADSRTIYKGMDVGTAKPSSAERAEVPHWGLDLVEPGAEFSVVDFKRYAERTITAIRGRGKIPFLIGGTGLYVDAVVFDYDFGSKADASLRGRLEELSLNELHEYCLIHNISLPENARNKRYVIRAIERNGRPAKRRDEPIPNTYIVGISTDKTALLSNIKARAEQIFENSVVDESILLGKKYGWGSEAMTGNVYPLIYEHLQGKITLDQAKDKFTTLDWRLAKRQLTWLRRNSYIKWLPKDEIPTFVGTVLACK